MYKQFFNLRENPFNVNQDPRYLFFTPSAQEALAGLTYGIQTRKGIVLLTGEVGTGKTTLLNKLLDWLHERQAATAFIFNTQLSVSELFDCLMADFGILPETRTKSGMLLRLYRWLLERHQAGRLAVLVVDEAQHLSHQALEEIRLLTNLETSTEKLLQIVLSGQPELEEKLRHPQLRQLRQRITVRCRTSPLTKEQTNAYILERLRIAGAATDGQSIFSPSAIETVHLYSLGIPRVVNLLCEHALINAYVEQQRPIQPKIMEDVAHEFQLDQIEPIASPESLRTSAELYNSESFIQNLGEALSRFRLSPDDPPSRERK